MKLTHYFSMILGLLGMIMFIIIGHIIIVFALKYTFNLQNPTMIGLIIGVCTASFFLTMTLTNMMYTPILSYIHTATSILFGTVYTLLRAGLIVSIYILITKLIGGYTPIVGKILFIAAIVLSVYGVRNGSNTKTIAYDVYFKNLPTYRQGKQIAMIADTHVGAIKNISTLKKVKNIIDSHDIQALLVAGDFYDGPRANDEELAQVLGTIKTPWGTYFAPGNHEEYGGLNKYLQYLSEAGIHILFNEKISLEGLQLIGVSYSETKNKDNYKQILSSIQVNSDEPSILIKHVPEHTDVVDEFSIDLQVAGHTHNGQVRPGPLLVRKIYGAVAYGMNKIGLSTIITTSGVGTRGPPQRLGTQSEVVIITLHNK